MTPREAFLQTVKQAVVEGNRAGATPPLPERSSVGYQGAGADPVQRFCQELAAAGGKGYVAEDREAVVHTIQSILQAHNARKILLSRGGVIDRLGIPAKLKELGLDVKTLDDIQAPLSSCGRGVGGEGRDDFFAAEIGITNVHRLIAETGTVVMATKPDEPRSASLLPPVHIALADRSQLLPDLFDLFDLFSPVATLSKTTPPSCLTLITGPSKTGDIELKLVTGVHGPGEIHVVLCGA
jgi:L-lactate dehydrogenase complex protein LldG